MRFLVDHQLPPVVARFIEAELGREAKHVADVGLRDASDAEVWQYASANELVLVSKDEDFTHIALKTSKACLIWVRVGAVDPSSWPNLLDRLESGERFVESR